VPTRPPWSVEEVLRLFLWVAVSFVLSGLVQGWLASVGLAQWIGLVAGQFLFNAIVLAAVHRLLRAHDVGWILGFGLHRRPPARAFGIGILAGLAFLPAAYGLQWLVSRLLAGFGIELPPQRSIELLVAAGPLGRGWIFLTAGILAPVVEEVVFRGVLFAAVRDAGWPRAALFGTAIVFGAIHFNLSVLAPLTAFGLLLALLLDRTGNLLAPIAAHMVFNAAPFLLLALGVDFGEGAR
jgi:uncharacterized protein